MRTSIRKYAVLAVVVLLAAILANISPATAGSFTIADFYIDGIGADPNFPNPNLPNYPNGYDILNGIGQRNATYTWGEKVKLADVTFTTGYNRWSSADLTGTLDPFAIILDGKQYQRSLEFSGTISYTDDITINSNIMTGLGVGKNIDLTIDELSFHGDGAKELRGTFTDHSASDPVPEPVSLLLLGIGLVALALWRRKRQHLLHRS